MRFVPLLLAMALASLEPAGLAPAGAQRPSSRDTRLARQHYQAGWDLLTAERFREAIGEFRQAIDLDDRYALAFYGEGKAHMALKEYVSAVSAYERCRGLYERATGDRLNAQYDRNDERREQLLILRENLRGFEQLPAQQRQRPEVQLAMRQIEDQIQQLDLAFERGSIVDPAVRIPAFVSLALGSAYFRSNRISDAERLYKEAIGAKPDYGEAHNNLAVVYLLTHRYAEAEREVKAAEKAGYKVQRGLKDDIKKGLKTGGTRP